jgi:hypothetical protein
MHLANQGTQAGNSNIFPPAGGNISSRTRIGGESQCLIDAGGKFLTRNSQPSTCNRNSIGLILLILSREMGD